ncbi:hemerythrin domain-containing protein [Streptacidiphilus sp. PAMC 29251]
MTDTIDFTMMYVTHHAFRRDLDRFAEAAAAGRADTPEVRAGWENFKAQLHLHHTVEDTVLWPRLLGAVTDPRDLVLLEQMEAEHAQIDPLLAAVDKALADGSSGPAGPGALAGPLRELTVALVAHLEHEETSTLPLIQSALTRADWRAFAGEMRRRQGVKGAAVYVPWILDGAPAAERRQFLKALPAPVGYLNRLLWQPRYSRRQLWNPVGAGR